MKETFFSERKEREYSLNLSLIFTVFCKPNSKFKWIFIKDVVVTANHENIADIRDE